MNQIEPYQETRLVEYVKEIGFTAFEHGILENDQIDSDLEEVSKSCDFFAFNLKATANLMICSIKADLLSSDEILGRVSKIDHTIKERKFGNLKLGLTRIGTIVWPLIFFTNSAKAKAFQESHQDACKINRMFPVRNILPYVIDLTGRKIYPYKGWPPGGSIKTKELEKAFFG